MGRDGLTAKKVRLFRYLRGRAADAPRTGPSKAELRAIGAAATAGVEVRRAGRRSNLLSRRDQGKGSG
jgi:hypothetical protein